MFEAFFDGRKNVIYKSILLVHHLRSNIFGISHLTWKDEEREREGKSVRDRWTRVDYIRNHFSTLGKRGREGVNEIGRE